MKTRTTVGGTGPWLLGSVVFAIGILALTSQGVAQRTVVNAAQLKAELEDPDGDDLILLASGEYEVSGALEIKRSVYIAAINPRKATLVQDSGRLTHACFLIDDSNFEEDNPAVVLKGLDFQSFDTAIYLNPNASDSTTRTLALTIDDCGFSYLYRGIYGDRENGDFTLQSFRVTDCDFSKILRRDTTGDARGQAAIRVFTSFDEAHIGARRKPNSFSDINYVAIQLGDNPAAGETLAQWNNATVEYNTITDVWNDNQSEECHGINTYGTNHVIRYNEVKDLWSVHASSGCEGIYCKVLTDLQIYDNVLTNAGGRAAMILIKNAELEKKFPALGVKTLVDGNVLNRTRFVDTTYSNGQVSFTAELNDRSVGIQVKGNEATIRHNVLGDRSDDEKGGNGALRISCGKISNPPAGVNCVITGNTLYTPTRLVPSNVNPGYAIEAIMHGGTYVIDDNVIDGVEASLYGQDPIGIKVLAIGKVIAYSIGFWGLPNRIKNLSADGVHCPTVDSIGIKVSGSANLNRYREDAVIANNKFDDSVDIRVSSN